jgi:hypothetical protein
MDRYKKAFRTGRAGGGMLFQVVGHVLLLTHHRHSQIPRSFERRKEKSSQFHHF